MPTPAHILKKFPKLTESEMRQRLALPNAPLRLVIDSDMHNEIDDQFTLAWALLSQDRLKIEGVYAAPYSFALYREPMLRAYELIKAGKLHEVSDVLEKFSTWAQRLFDNGIDPYSIPFVQADEGMELSYQETLTVYAKLGQDPTGKVFRGSPGYLPSCDQPIHSPAASHLIERALAKPDEPLYVAAIGALTNVASALLLEPSISRNIVVLWTAGFPSRSRQRNTTSFNLIQDLAAAQLLYDCGVPLVYLPGFHVGAQLRLSLPDVETWVRGRGAMGDYLYHLYTHNPIHQQRGIQDHFARTWVIWDLINIAWLLNPSWVPSELTTAPILLDDASWQCDVAGRHVMREAYDVDRDGIFRDLFLKLEEQG